MKHPVSGTHPGSPADAEAGSEVSLRHLLENRDIQGLVGHDLLEPGIFTLELLQAFRLVHAEAAIFTAPAVVGLLTDGQLTAYGADFCPLASSTSAARNLAMICSGLKRFFGICLPLPWPRF